MKISTIKVTPFYVWIQSFNPSIVTLLHTIISSIMQRLYIWIITFIFVVGKVQNRILRLNSSDQFISNGIDQVENRAKCDHLYGFFPCADNVGGFVFLIAIYQYLLIVGEKLVSNGSKTIFNILGTGIFGATLFQILKGFPRIILVIG